MLFDTPIYLFFLSLVVLIYIMCRRSLPGSAHLLTAMTGRKVFLTSDYHMPPRAGRHFWICVWSQAVGSGTGSTAGFKAGGMRVLFTL